MIDMNDPGDRDDQDCKQARHEVAMAVLRDAPEGLRKCALDQTQVDDDWYCAKLRDVGVRLIEIAGDPDPRKEKD